MSAQPPSDPQERRSVLDRLTTRNGIVSKVLLPDSGSEHGVSPIVAAGSASRRVVPQGRAKYQILGEIARGGMGVILKGHDGDLGRDLAIKVLDPELAKNPAVVSRFVEEAQIGGQLQHPGIVPVYELGLMADESPYFTMKLVKGRTLSALLTQRKTLAENRTRLLAVFESVCQTLAYAHSKGVLHRDLKPANIMVGAFGEVQVVDWGLAKVLRRGGVADEQRAKDHTQSVFTIIETVRSGPGSSGSDSIMGAVMGTPAYMSPEQAQGEVEKLDERADVFALGATLCEILTGRPPYESTDAEPALVLAARAKLDPARARIAACDADPALKALCLECMTPARDARPRDAESVARAVHDYLSSVEERAHRAEVAATAERVKGQEQRRRLRLTIALVGSVCASLLLGGGGLWWIQGERHARSERVRATVEQAFADSLQCQQEGRVDDALTAARAGAALTTAEDVDTALRERAQAFVQKAEAAVAEVAAEQQRQAQDETLRRQLVALRLRQIETIGNRDRERLLHDEFLAAFRDYGVDLDGDTLLPALERMRERHIAEEVALALDDLGRIRRNLFGHSSPEMQRSTALAMDLDPDPTRLRLRDAIRSDDLPTLLAFAAPERLTELPPGSLWVLSATLWDRYPEHRPDVYRLYDQALYLYPDDYVLQAVGATIYKIAGRHQAALACRRAAFALQPANLQARLDLAEGLFFAGHMVDSLGVYRACVARAPNHAAAHNGLGWAQLQLGDFAGAASSFQRAAALDDKEAYRADLLAARYLAGHASKADVEQCIRISTLVPAMLGFALVLADHPDAERRDPARAMALVHDAAIANDYATAGALIECVAALHAGDPARAEKALAAFDERTEYLLLTPQCYPYVRAVLHAQLGHQDAARECLARGEQGFRDLVGNDDADWVHSDLVRWRTLAQRALAR